MRSGRIFLTSALAAVLLGVYMHAAVQNAAAAPPKKKTAAAKPLLEEVAFIRKYQPTGIAVSKSGRIFMNFPRWDPDYKYAVGELPPDLTLKPYPDKKWNEWDGKTGARERFVCVQSVYLDKNGFLWILDAGAPDFGPVVPGGPKLVKVAPGNNEVASVTTFDESIAPKGSYLNDVRIDTEGDVAYITDSGLGAIIVVDLKTGQKRRLLAKNYSVRAQTGYVPKINGKEWRTSKGEIPQINADGIALSPDGTYLYYHALTARALYRIKTAFLKDPSITPVILDTKVEYVADTGAVDGMEMDGEGNLYLASIEKNAIIRLTPEGRMETIITDKRILWPDSISITHDGYLYFTISQINLMPRFNNGVSKRTEPYWIFRVRLPEKSKQEEPIQE